MSSDTERTIMMDPAEVPAQPPPKPKRSARGQDGTYRTVVDYFLPFFMGFSLMCLMWLFVLPALPQEGFLHTVYIKLAEREWVPPVCMVLFFWHLSHVLIRLTAHVLPERRVLRADLIPRSGDAMSPEELEAISMRAIAMLRSSGSGLLVKRILLAVAHLGIRHDTAELGDLLRRRAEADRQRAASAYAVPNFIFWAIPILGFVGTVMGIGRAVMNISSLGGATDTEEMAKGIGNVAGDLGIAFDTTLVALLLSIVVLFVQIIVRQMDARTHADVEDYLTYRLQSRIKTETVDTRMEEIMREALQGMTDLQSSSQEEQQERASMALQTMMSSQESVKDALAELPELLSNAAKNSQTIMGQTRSELENVAVSLRDTVTEGFHEIREGLEHAVKQQTITTEEVTRTLQESAKGVANLLAAAGEHLSNELDGIADNMKERLGEGARRMEEAIAGAGEKTQSSLFAVADRLDTALNDGKELLSLQSSLRDNLDQLVRIQRIDETFAQMRQSLVALGPALNKLSQPIPVRLTLTGVELPDAGSNDGDGDGDSATFLPPNLAYGELKAPEAQPRATQAGPAAPVQAGGPSSPRASAAESAPAPGPAPASPAPEKPAAPPARPSAAKPAPWSLPPKPKGQAAPAQEPAPADDPPAEGSTDEEAPTSG